MTWASIDVVRDTVGIRLAALEVLEQAFESGRIERTAAQASPESRARLLASIPRPTSAAGYLRWCDHLWSLEAQQKAGFVLDGITAFEMLGMVAMAEARREYEGKHPECSACKARQPNRYGVKCDACGASFRRKK